MSSTSLECGGKGRSKTRTGAPQPQAPSCRVLPPCSRRNLLAPARHPLTPQTQPAARPAAALNSGVLGMTPRSRFTAAAWLGTRRFRARQAGGPGPGQGGPSTVPRMGAAWAASQQAPGSRTSTAWVHPPETAPTGWLRGCQPQPSHQQGRQGFGTPSFQEDGTPAPHTSRLMSPRPTSPPPTH